MKSRIKLDQLLVCESYPGFRQVFELMLGEQYDLIVTDKPDELSVLLQQQPFRLLIWDIDGCSADILGILRSVRKTHPDLKILLVSGEFDSEFQVVAIEQCGLVRFLSKPWNSEEAVEQIQVMLGDRQSSIKTRVLGVPLSNTQIQRVALRTGKQFSFSTAYRGSPQTAIDILLHPECFIKGMPFVRRIEILQRLSPESIVSSWEVEVDGATLTWREKTVLVPDRQAVVFQMIKGDFRSYAGEWSVRQEGDQVVIALDAELDWGAPNLSQFVADILHRRAERALRGMVLAVGRMAAHRSFELERTTNRFGFIFHPLDLGLFAEGFDDQDLKMKRPALVEQVLTWLPPFRRSLVDGIRSSLGKETRGDMILCPLLPKQMLMLDDKFVLARLIEAGRLAERYGDKILGLGAYAAAVGRKGVLLAKQMRIPVTTGSSYTIAVAIEATLKASRMVGIRLNEATVAVVGATGTIGHVCASLMAREARHLLLVARNQQRLEDVAQSLRGQGGATIAALSDLEAALTNADIVITATNTPAAIIDVTKLKLGAVVCDISRPRNVSQESALLRPDVLVLDGGIVRPPGNPDFHFSFGLPPGLAYACMAETMILALEERFQAYSLGGDVDLEKVRDIAQLGRKHGFALAGLRSFDEEVSEGHLQKVREARAKPRRKRANCARPLRPSA